MRGGEDRSDSQSNILPSYTTNNVLLVASLLAGEKPHEFALRVQCMTAAHLGLGVINMNWKEKDRLQQALGFVPYNEALWSRRKSMDIFRENLFKRQVVLKDGHAVVGDKKVMPISADEEEEEMEEGTKCAHGSSKNVIKPNYDENEKNGVFLAK